LKCVPSTEERLCRSHFLNGTVTMCECTAFLTQNSISIESMINSIDRACNAAHYRCLKLLLAVLRPSDVKAVKRVLLHGNDGNSLIYKVCSNLNIRDTQRIECMRLLFELLKERRLLHQALVIADGYGSTIENILSFHSYDPNIEDLMVEFNIAKNEEWQKVGVSTLTYQYSKGD